jgi:hypothetical protein
MLVSCLLSASEIGATAPDVIVFPEGVDSPEIAAAGTLHPNAVIVTAIHENEQIVGKIYHRNHCLVEYTKVISNIASRSPMPPAALPVLELADLCLGMLICRDVDERSFADSVLDRIRSSPARLKLLCIPADMGGNWFSETTLPFRQRFAGIHVLLCNHTRTVKTTERYSHLLIDRQEEALMKLSGAISV